MASGTQEVTHHKVYRCGAAAVLAASAAMLGACGATPPPAVGAAQTQPVESLGQGDYASTPGTEYPLRNSDIVSINVFREPDLSLDKVAVGADGMLSIPLVGPISATGRTTSELASDIALALGQAGLKNPRVSVNIIEHASHLVTVEGGVTEPGVFPFQPGAKLSSAIAMAKGPNRVAQLREVAVFRDTPQGLMVAKFDYHAVRQGTMLDPVLQPGDRVVVGISGLSQFWQDLLRALPAFALFTNVNW